MKKIYLHAAFVLLCFAANAQTGSSRLDAIPVQPQGLCSYSDFTTTGTEMWFKFVAQSEKVAIELQSEKYGNDQAHIHNLKLYRNNETTEMAQDELPFNAESRKLRINLNAGNLTPGESYYLRADRIPREHTCKKEFCRHNGFTNPAQLRLCVQNVSVYIPNDFNGDKPSIAHAFEVSRGQLADLDGQVVNDVLMYSPQSFPQVYLGNTFTSYVWAKIDEDSITNDTIHRIDMELVNAQLNERILQAEEITGHTNYYKGHNPDGITENKSYSRVIRQNVYNDIDAHYYSNEHGLKMYFVVNENGSHQDINFRFTGGASTELTPNGGLKIKSSIGGMTFEKALVYYINPAGQNVPMPQSGRIIETGAGNYGVEVVETYPPKRKLIIQLEQDGPTRGGDIPWGTFFGGDGTDGVKDIEAASNENFYITGSAAEVGFPIAGPDIYDGTFNGIGDGFLAKFDPEYKRVWCTYLGGQYQDLGQGVAHDNVNNVTYVVGLTRNDETTSLARPFVTNPACYIDAVGEDKSFFISRFNDVGDLEWLSYLPIWQNELIRVRVDNAGNVICAGTILPPLNPTPTFSCAALPNGDLPICRTNPLAYMQDHHSGGEDIFIMKFSPNLDLTWSTYLGGGGSDFIRDIEIDANNIHIIGFTNSQSCTSCYPDNLTFNFPVKASGGYTQETISNYDGFVSRFSLDGVLNWSSFYGGAADDFVTDGALHNGQLVIGGITHTTYYHDVEGEPSNKAGFPKKHYNTTGFFQDNYGGGATDDFVAQFRGNTALLWSTFIGGEGIDGLTTEHGVRVDINELDQLFIAGRTESGSNDANGSIDPIDNPYFYSNPIHSDYLPAGANQNDVYVKGFNPDRTNFWATYLGSKSALIGDVTTGIQTIKERVYVVGIVYNSESFPLNCPIGFPDPYCQTNFSVSTGGNGFLTQLKIGTDFYNSIDEFSDLASKFVVYPNPNTGMFVLDTKDLTDNIKAIEINNQVGQVVKSIEKPKQMGSNQYEININDLVDGIYFVTLNYQNQQFTTKVIKQ